MTTTINNQSYAIFRSAMESEVGVWLKLAIFCEEHQNGNYVILDAQMWTDRDWLARAGVSERPSSTSKFWEWHGLSLLVLKHEA